MQLAKEAVKIRNNRNPRHTIQPSVDVLQLYSNLRFRDQRSHIRLIVVFFLLPRVQWRINYPKNKFSEAKAAFSCAKRPKMEHAEEAQDGPFAISQRVHGHRVRTGYC